MLSLSLLSWWIISSNQLPPPSPPLLIIGTMHPCPHFFNQVAPTWYWEEGPISHFTNICWIYKNNFSLIILFSLIFGITHLCCWRDRRDWLGTKKKEIYPFPLFLKLIFLPVILSPSLTLAQLNEWMPRDL